MLTAECSLSSLTDEDPRAPPSLALCTRTFSLGKSVTSRVPAGACVTELLERITSPCVVLAFGRVTIGGSMPSNDVGVISTSETGVCSAELKRDLLATLPQLRAFSISLCGDVDRGDDLVQDTLLRAWSHLDQFNEGTNLRAWLFTIARNTYFSSLRKRRREIEDAEGNMAARLAVLPEQLTRLDMHDFRAALDKLPVDQREALLLIGAAGFSYEEAAEISGCAVGTIKSRVNRGRTRLVQLLGVASGADYGSEPLFGAIVFDGAHASVG